MRLGEEFRDLEDVRYLLRYLNVSTVPNAVITSREAAKQSPLNQRGDCFGQIISSQMTE